MNPIVQAMQQTQQTPSVKTMFDAVKNAGNPQAVLQQLMKSNPQVQQAANYISQHGGDGKAAFYALAKEKGMDPNQILNMFR